MLSKFLALGSLLMVAGFTLFSHGAQIAWDSVVLDFYEAWNPPDNPLDVGLQIYYLLDSDELGVLLRITAEPDGDQIKITSHPSKNLAYWINCAFAGPGDMIDDYSMQNLSGDSGYALLDPESIIVPTDEATLFYLIFSTELWYKNDIYYGWIEMEYFDHEFTLVHSAVTTGGEPLTVGVIPVPEPSSAVLLVLGLMAAVTKCKMHNAQ